MVLRLALLTIAACLVMPASAWSGGKEPSAPAPAARVGIFYYPWFATPQHDGGFAHWQQGGRTPPASLASGFYPARGPYSSADALVLDAQMGEIAAAGIGTVIASWWGRGSVEDQRLPRGDRSGASARARRRGAPRALRRPHRRHHAKATSALCARSGSRTSTSGLRPRSPTPSGRS